MKLKRRYPLTDRRAKRWMSTIVEDLDLYLALTHQPQMTEIVKMFFNHEIRKFYRIGQQVQRDKGKE